MIVSIIIPVYNEIGTLAQVLQQVLAAPLPPGCDREILVVDGGSTDGSRAFLTSIAHPGIKTILYASNGRPPFGKGTAIRVALDQVRGECVLIQDADLEYDPADYSRLFGPMISGQAEVVFGSRFLNGCRRQELGMSSGSWLANRILSGTANILYRAGLSDEATAYKVFRTELLRSLQLRCRRFEFCPEVTAKLCRRGIRIHEVPVQYHARSRASGKKIRARDGCVALWTLLRYRVGN
ncbi:MAG: glycosyltransferase family 2 protein [Acidobacteria bacterium]|nr:MAG: glycosyltransferase family 2 protein [Acidobacteriota bacterium]